MFQCRHLIASACVAACLATAAVAASDATRWQALTTPVGFQPALALALDPQRERLAVGGERGALLGPISGRLERVISRGPVEDLRFAADGTLIAATGSGLLRVEPSGRVRAESLSPGEGARALRGIDAAAGWLAAATDAGVFLRPDPGAGAWRRVAGLPFGAAARVALREEAEGLAVWALIDASLWRAVADQGGRRVTLPGVPEGEGAVDLAHGPDGELWVLWPRALARLPRDGPAEGQRLALPPGARARRIAVEPGRMWIATDAGLVGADGPRGPWRRAAAPVGHVEVSALAGSGGRLVVATAHGLLRRALVSSFAASPRPSSREPAVADLHRIALSYLDLEPARMRALAGAASDRGWWPELEVRGGYGRDRERAIDLDRAYVSGATRALVDRDRSHAEEFGAEIELSWDLGDAIFHPDRVNVSRESRLVAQLRDEVLDEITQLYFERRRVLAALSAAPGEVSPLELELRAQELASGLDAWTGGWFSAQLARDRGPSHPAEESKR